MKIEICRNESIQLTDNDRYSYYGRVEVCINNEWKQICGHHMTYSEASVICQELGFSKYGKLIFYKYIYNCFIKLGIIRCID